MGREAAAICRWRGARAETKALLETHEIILRGDLRLRIDRASIGAMSLDGASLNLTVSGEPLALELGAKEAGKWLAALQKPAPTLAEKLGVSAARPAFVLGAIDDAALQAALAGAMTRDVQQAAVLIAILRDEADLSAAISQALAAPNLPVWCVYAKGKSASPSDAEIRAAMRARGLIDTKISAVSDTLTATRYRMRTA